MSIQPTHPRVCPDTSRGADTAVSEVGNLQEEASGLPRTETTKLTPALRSDSAMCHLPGVPPSHVARDTPGCDNVLTRPTIFGDSLRLLLLLSLPQLLPRAVPNSIHPLPQEPPPALSSQGPSDRGLEGRHRFPSVSPMTGHGLGTGTAGAVCAHTGHIGLNECHTAPSGQLLLATISFL